MKLISVEMKSICSEYLLLASGRPVIVIKIATVYVNPPPPPPQHHHLSVLVLELRKSADGHPNNRDCHKGGGDHRDTVRSHAVEKINFIDFRFGNRSPRIIMYYIQLYRKGEV